MKTAVTQIIEKLEYTKLNSCKHLHEVVFFDGVLAIIEGGGFLETEKQQIIEANINGTQEAFSIAFKSISGRDLVFTQHDLNDQKSEAEQYYEQTFNNQ